MTPRERRTRIVDIVRQNERAGVDALAVALDISRETIRRDLTELARAGKIHKYHGGAMLPSVRGEGPFQQRMADNAAAKAIIAAAAVELFKPGETIFIDTGSTTLYFAEKLVELADLTIVTNSAEVARVMGQARGRHRVFLLGGEYSADNRQTVGTLAVAQIRSFRAHHVVLTVGGLDTRTGVMDFNIEEAQVARAMIDQADRLTVLADAAKFDRIASFEVCRLAAIANLVCDRPPAGGLGEALARTGTRIFPAGPNA